MSDAPEQRSDEWFAKRRGNLGASMMADAMAKARSGPGYGATRANLMAKLVAERMTGVSEESYTSAAMQRGIDIEPEGIAAVEAHTGLFIEPVSFVPHPTIEWFGASPDGLILDDGCFELKCPETKTHINTILTGKVDRRYLIQMQVQMACTMRAWTLFASYDPRMHEKLNVWTIRIERDDDLIAEIESEAVKFLDELERMEAALWARVAMVENE